MTKVLIVEDEPLIAKEIAFNLQDYGYDIAGVAHSYEKALTILQNREVDIALLDIAIKGTRNGIELGELLKAKYQIPFLFLSSYCDDDTVQEASAAGAEGYIVKPFKKSDLKPAIEIALSNSGLRKRTIPTREEINDGRLERITKSEYDIIRCICEGKVNSDIASELNISINTVKKHTSNIYRKLDVNRKPNLIAFIQGMMKNL